MKKPVKRKLKVFSLNCNGLKGLTKRAEFHSYIELHQPDIILGCESKVDTDIPTYSIFPESYDIVRKDRSSSEGGVFIAVRNNLVGVKVRRLDVKGSEVVTVSLLTKQRNFTLSATIAHQHRCSLDLLDDVLGKLCNIRSGYPHTILGGDFNSGAIDWCSGDPHSDIPTHACDNALLEIADVWLNPAREISNPSRFWENIKSCVFYHQQTHPACHVNPGICDYDAILFEVDVAPKFAPKPPRRVYQFLKGEYEGLRAHLSSFRDYYLVSGPEERSVEDN